MRLIKKRDCWWKMDDVGKKVCSPPLVDYLNPVTVLLITKTSLLRITTSSNQNGRINHKSSPV